MVTLGFLEIRSCNEKDCARLLVSLHYTVYYMAVLVYPVYAVRTLLFLFSELLLFRRATRLYLKISFEFI